VSEGLREAALNRLPWAFAFVSPDVEPGLQQAGVRFERVGGPPHPDGYRDTRVMLRINALASVRRLQLDYRVPKVTAVKWVA
jgi:hypothetical protein